MHGISAFSSAVIGFPGFFLWLTLSHFWEAGRPIGGIFGFCSANRGSYRGFGFGRRRFCWDCWSLRFRLVSLLLFAKGLLNESSIHVFTFFNRKLLQLSPKVVELTHGGIIWGSFDFINHRLQTTYGPKLVRETLQAFFDWATACKSATGYPLSSTEKIDWEVMSGPRTLSKSKRREIIWMTARPRGAWLWRVQISICFGMSTGTNSWHVDGHHHFGTSTDTLLACQREQSSLACRRALFLACRRRQSCLACRRGQPFWHVDGRFGMSTRRIPLIRHRCLNYQDLMLDLNLTSQ